MKATLEQAIEAHKLGKLQDAKELYLNILQDEPKHPEANHNLGVLAVSVNNLTSALSLFRTALEADPKKEQYWISYINALIKSQQFDNARNILNQAKKIGLAEEKVLAINNQLNRLQSSDRIGTSSQAKLKYIAELRELGRYEEAQKELSLFIEINPKEAEAWSLLSQILLLAKQDVESEKALKIAVSLSSELPSIYRNHARLFLWRDKLKEALNTAESAYQSSPEDPESLIVLAACLIANQNDKAAVFFIEKALKIRPNYAEAFANRAVIRLKAKDLNNAILDFENAVSIKPHLSQVWSALGAVHYQNNNLIGAIKALKKVSELEPENILNKVSLGELFRKENRHSEAIEILEEVTSISPENADAWTNLGTALQEIGELEKAKSAYKKSLAIKPESAEISSNLGAIEKEAGNWEAAQRYFRQATIINPDLVEAHINLGIALRELGRLEEATSSLRQSIALRPDYAEAHKNLGITLKALNQTAEAKASFRQAIALNEDYLEARYNLGILLYECGEVNSAVEQFRGLNFEKSESYLLRCLFFQNDISTFKEQLDKIVIKGENNALIGSLCSRASFKYSLDIYNPFCEEPFKYVMKTDLAKKYDFKVNFVDVISDLLSINLISSRHQTLLINGDQSAGNLFSSESFLIKNIASIIRIEIENYFSHFAKSQEGLIKSWSPSYDLHGWVIKMKSGGKLRPHMHEMGWISGSIYINVPQKNNENSGNLVLCIDDLENHEDAIQNPIKIIDVFTGCMVFFPSSLMHYTIPFESNEERIVLAFDVVPKIIQS
jgi:tetratricopeptide (TPR) repeat protein